MIYERVSGLRMLRVILKKIVHPVGITIFFVFFSVMMFSLFGRFLDFSGDTGFGGVFYFPRREGVYIIFTAGMLYLALMYNRKELSKSREVLRSSLEETVLSMIRMVESRDSYTAGHSGRVAKYARALGESMGLSSEELDRLWKTGLLHDIGKVETPDTILLKPDRLSVYERKIIEKHPVTGHRILYEISIYRNLARIILHHHEWYNGKGYPAGLKGKDIPLESRILSVADSFDAMTTNRVYRTRLPMFRALELIKENSGVQFDPEVCLAAERVFSRFEPEIDRSPTSVFLEAERMSYYFRDRETARYSHEFLQFLANNRDALLIEEAWVIGSCSGNDEPGKKCDALLEDLGNHPGVMIIQLDSDRICALFSEMQPEMRSRFPGSEDLKRSMVVYDGERFKSEVLEAVLSKNFS